MPVIAVLGWAADGGANSAGMYAGSGQIHRAHSHLSLDGRTRQIHFHLDRDDWFDDRRLGRYSL